MKLKLLRNTELGNIYCFDVDSTKYILKEIVDHKTYDQALFRFSENPTIVDVGGNIGIFSLYYAKKLPNAKIFSIEPIPDNFKALTTNIGSSKYSERITPINYGLTDFDGPAEADFTYYPNSSVLSTMYKPIIEEGFFRKQTVETSKIFYRSIKSRINPIKYYFNMFFLSINPISTLILKAMIKNYSKTVNIRCKLTNLSDIIEKHGITNIDLLKMDAEGAEVKILNGIKPKHWLMIQQIAMEIHHRDYVEIIMKLLKKKGFKNIILEDDDYLKSDIENFQKLYASRG